MCLNLSDLRLELGLSKNAMIGGTGKHSGACGELIPRRLPDTRCR
jgi:hypothetical protein